MYVEVTTGKKSTVRIMRRGCSTALLRAFFFASSATILAYLATALAASPLGPYGRGSYVYDPSYGTFF